MIPSRPSRLAAVLLLAIAAGCSRTSASATLESELPARPGQPWDAARAALSALDPQLHEATGLAGRSASARTPITVGGQRFAEVTIAGAVDHGTVRSIRLAGPAELERCGAIRDGLLAALGPSWEAGPTRLGITEAKLGHRGARIVCTGSEISLLMF